MLCENVLISSVSAVSARPSGWQEENSHSCGCRQWQHEDHNVAFGGEDAREGKCCVHLVHWPIKRNALFPSRQERNTNGRSSRSSRGGGAGGGSFGQCRWHWRRFQCHMADLRSIGCIYMCPAVTCYSPVMRHASIHCNCCFLAFSSLYISIRLTSLFHRDSYALFCKHIMYMLYVVPLDLPLAGPAIGS